MPIFGLSRDRVRLVRVRHAAPSPSRRGIASRWSRDGARVARRGADHDGPGRRHRHPRACASLPDAALDDAVAGRALQGLRGLITVHSRQPGVTLLLYPLLPLVVPAPTPGGAAALQGHQRDRLADSSPSTWPVVVSIWLLLPLWGVMGDHRRTFGCSLVWPQRSGALLQVVHLLDPPADDADHPGDETHPKLLNLRL